MKPWKGLAVWLRRDDQIVPHYLGLMCLVYAVYLDWGEWSEAVVYSHLKVIVVWAVSQDGTGACVVG